MCFPWHNPPPPWTPKTRIGVWVIIQFCHEKNKDEERFEKVTTISKIFCRRNTFSILGGRINFLLVLFIHNFHHESNLFLTKIKWSKSTLLSWGVCFLKKKTSLLVAWFYNICNFKNKFLWLIFFGKSEFSRLVRHTTVHSPTHPTTTIKPQVMGKSKMAQ